MDSWIPFPWRIWNDKIFTNCIIWTHNLKNKKSKVHPQIQRNPTMDLKDLNSRGTFLQNFTFYQIFPRENHQNQRSGSKLSTTTIEIKGKITKKRDRIIPRIATKQWLKSTETLKKSKVLVGGENWNSTTASGEYEQQKVEGIPAQRHRKFQNEAVERDRSRGL